MKPRCWEYIVRENLYLELDDKFSKAGARSVASSILWWHGGSQSLGDVPHVPLGPSKALHLFDLLHSFLEMHLVCSVIPSIIQKMGRFRLQDILTLCRGPVRNLSAIARNHITALILLSHLTQIWIRSFSGLIRPLKILTVVYTSKYIVDERSVAWDFQEIKQKLLLH